MVGDVANTMAKWLASLKAAFALAPRIALGDVVFLIYLHSLVEERTMTITCTARSSLGLAPIRHSSWFLFARHKEKAYS